MLHCSDCTNGYLFDDSSISLICNQASGSKVLALYRLLAPRKSTLNLVLHKTNIHFGNEARPLFFFFFHILKQKMDEDLILAILGN